MKHMTRTRSKNWDETKIQFYVSDIDGRASQGCPELRQWNYERKTRIRTQLSDIVPETALTAQCVVSVVQDLFGKYSPDELEEIRRETNKPRRRPEKDKHEVIELQNLHAEGPICKSAGI